MLIVVAGQYNANTDEEKAKNLKAMNIAAAAVYKKGHIPVIGVNASLYVADELPEFDRRQVISDISFAVVERCDAILVIGSSPGANHERKIIESKGLPVYFSVNDIPETK